MAAAAAGAGAGDISALEARVIKQIEFYFGDSNLPRDNHLKAMVALDNGWVPLAHLASFNRMKEITSDVAVIAAALKKSKAGLVEVSADNTKVKRTSALPEKVDWNVRAIYAKGFPATATMDSINEFFAPKGKVLSVRVRRNPDKTFKGSAFVEFSSEEEAKSIAAAEHKLADGTVLITLHKPAYMAKKKDEAKEQKGGKKNKKAGEAEGAGATKKRKTEGAADVKAGADAGDAKDGAAAAAAAEPAKPKEYVKDLLVSFAKLPAETTREDLKEACMAVGGTVRYVDYSKSQPAGIVRLDEASAVKATEVAKQLVEKGLLIKNLKPDLSALSGDDEKKAWDVIFEKQSSGAAKKKADGGGRGGRGRGRGRGGRGGGRGRGGRGGKKGGAKADDG